MSEDKLQRQRRISPATKEKFQYALAFAVIATMLMIAEFPMFVILFLGVFAFFLWKTFSSASPSFSREIFEFYLSANEILRDDDRRWFGFEVRDVISRGEKISRAMLDVPPLVLFALGALHNKIGDQHEAARLLSHVVEDSSTDEFSIVTPSPELRQYAKILRRIESQPSDAPQTSAAIRSLERARRNRGKILLEASRDAIAETNRRKLEAVGHSGSEPIEKSKGERTVLSTISHDVVRSMRNQPSTDANSYFPNEQRSSRATEKHAPEGEHHANRKSITEVLHDIYDRKTK